MRRRAFTLVELLVTITIIGLLAAMVLGALGAARESAREAATRATIAKLSNIIMKRYESYMTRRIGYDNSGMTSAQIQAAEAALRATTTSFALNRLYALRDLIRMEMPDRTSDVTDDPIVLPCGYRIRRPPVSMAYRNYLTAHATTSGNSAQAEWLYLLVSISSPESMEHFSQSEIGDTDGNGWMEFLDGWGRPIFFLRWAPGFSGCKDPDFVKATGIHYTGFSEIQSGIAQSYPQLNPDGSPKFTRATNPDGTPMTNPDGSPVLIACVVNGDHDPLDSRNIDSAAFQLIPLVYSAGAAGDYGLDVVSGYHFNNAAHSGNMFADNDFLKIGMPNNATAYGIITNHETK